MTDNQPIEDIDDVNDESFEESVENEPLVNDERSEQQGEASTAEESEESTDERWREEVFTNDLESVKKSFPFVAASHISELGEGFLSLMALGAQNGLSAVDAFAATHREEIAANMEKEARQQALTKLESKAHMKPMLGVGANTTEVPRATYEKYKRLIPGITDSEIRRHYNKAKED